MKKNILHVVNVYFVLPYFFGDQFLYLRKKGYNLNVLCSPSGYLDNYARKMGFKYLEVKIVKAISPLKDLIAFFTICHYIRKNKIDIVFGHTPKGGLLSMLAAWSMRVPSRVYFRHGLMYETSVGFKKFMLKGIEQFTGALSTQVVCVSQSVLEISDQLNLSKPSKNLLLGKGTCNGINIDKFSRKNGLMAALVNISKTNEYIVGYVGRLVKDKGIEELIGGWKLVLSRYSNCKLLIVGPFEKRDAISDSTANYIKTEPSIIFTDFVEDTIPYYMLMDLLILPSYREGFPTVVLEASAMELPVITTRSTGCIDSILENQTGIYTTIDSHDIASKIGFYISNPEIGKLHGSNGRKFVKNNFSQELLWNEIENKILKND